MKEVDAQNCGRENDLIGFLYGELNEFEASAFQQHLHECAACRTEIAGFKDVRESVVNWRNESLGTIGLPVQAADSALLRASQVKPSAMAAWREFFNLSPLWLRGAVVFGSILFCLLAGLGLRSYLGQHEPAPLVVTNSGYTQQEVDALVERRVREELARIKNANESAPVPATMAAGPSNPGSGRRITSHANVAANDPNQRARRPLSKTEREQLAVDLRLTSSKSDNELDLLDDRINQ
jgi:anti-sigma factor RsiW